MFTYFKTIKTRFTASRVGISSLVGCLVFLATACLPIPFFEQESPNTDGLLMRQGKPAADVQVFLAVNEELSAGCSKGRAETRTDKNGRFHLDRTGYLSPIFRFYGAPRTDHWALCFKFADGLEAVWRFSYIFGGPPLQRIECQVSDVAKPSGKPLSLVTANPSSETMSPVQAKSNPNIPDSCYVENIKATPTPKPSTVTSVSPTDQPTTMLSASSFSPPTSGTRLTYKKSVNDQPALAIVNMEGKGSTTLPLPAGATIKNLSDVLSPDGKWLAFYTGSAEQTRSFDLALNLMELPGGQTRSIVRLLSANYSQNFRQAADLLDKQGTRLVEGIDQAVILRDAFLFGIYSLDWSPDGRYLAFAGQMDGLSSDLYIYDVKTQAIRRLSDEPDQIQSITWSPDGKWILIGSANLVGVGAVSLYHAVAIDSVVVKTLPNNIAGIRGWLGPSTYLQSSMTNGPAGTYDLQSVDIETGAITQLWKGTYLSYSFDPVEHTLGIVGYESVGSQAPPTLFLVDLSNSRVFKIGEAITRVEFIGMGNKRFIATSEKETLFVKSDRSLTSTGFNTNRVRVSSHLRFVVVLGDTLQVYAWGDDLVRDIKLALPASAIDKMIWWPDAPGLFFNFGSELYAVNLIDGQAQVVDRNVPAHWELDHAFSMPAAIGSQAVWEVPRQFNAEFNTCLRVQRSPRECLVSVMRSLGANPQSVEFTRLLYGDAFMILFEDEPRGVVNLASVIFHPRPNDILRCVMVNGTPRIVYAAEDLGRIDITHDPLYPTLARQYPKLTIWESLHQFERMERLGEDGQRFIFRYDLVEGCHNCRTGSSALVAFDFRAGQFIGTKLLSLEE